MNQHVLHFLDEVQASFDVTSIVMSTYNKESSESFEASSCRLLNCDSSPSHFQKVLLKTEVRGYSEAFDNTQRYILKDSSSYYKSN